MRHRLPQAEEPGPHRLRHGTPAAQGVESQHRDGHRATDQDEHLQQIRVEHRTQSAEDGVHAGDHHDHQRAGPEVDPHDRLEDDATGVNGHGDLGYHVADDGDHRQIPPGGLRVASLEELRHGVDATRQVERHEQPAEEQEHQRGNDLELPHGHTARSPHSRQPHQVLGSDVGGEQRAAYQEPADIAARQEVVLRRPTRRPLPHRRPDRDAEDEDEVPSDHHPVHGRQQAHGHLSGSGSVAGSHGLWAPVSVAYGIRIPALTRPSIRRSAS